jgi:hypothetical protein
VGEKPGTHLLAPMPTTEELAEIASMELARERARAVLLANKDVPFVRRMLNPRDYPAIWNDEGRPQTVRLGTHGVDGREWVVPDIAYEGDRLVEGAGRENWVLDQIARGNAIPFDDAALADEFARGEDSWKALLLSRGGDLIDDRISRPAPERAGVVPTPLELALRRAMRNEPAPIGPGSWPALP